MTYNVNGWRISKVRGLDGFDHWICKNGKIKGRAIKDKKEWTAFDEHGRKEMFHGKGVEVTAKTLDGLVMALADCEMSMKARDKQESDRRIAAALRAL